MNINWIVERIENFCNKNIKALDDYVMDFEIEVKMNGSAFGPLIDNSNYEFSLSLMRYTFKERKTPSLESILWVFSH